MGTVDLRVELVDRSLLALEAPGSCSHRRGIEAAPSDSRGPAACRTGSSPDRSARDAAVFWRADIGGCRHVAKVGLTWFIHR